MDDNAITQETPIEPTFDQIIGRVRNYLAYGYSDKEVIDLFLSEGFDQMEIYLTVAAAKLL